MRYLAPKTAPRRDQDLPKSGPKHLPRRTWQPKTAKNLKNLENDPQKSMGYPSGPRFWSLHGCIWDHFGGDAAKLRLCWGIWLHFEVFQEHSNAQDTLLENRGRDPRRGRDLRDKVFQKHSTAQNTLLENRGRDHWQLNSSSSAVAGSPLAAL